MVYNSIRVSRLISGAVVDDVIHDQWIKTVIKGREFMIFDQDAICSEKRIGEPIEAKIGLMPVKIEKASNCITKDQDERSFVCMIIERKREEDAYEYLLKISNLKVYMTENTMLEVGSYYRIKGRLDLISIKGLNSSGWRPVA